MSYYNNDPNNNQGGGGGYYGNNMDYSSSNYAAGGGGGGYEFNAPANVQAWQASAQQQSYAPQQQQQQQQALPGVLPGVWNPAAAAAMAAVAGSMAGGGNDVMFNSLSTAGQSFFQQGTARMIPGLESTMLLLRSYFAVDNNYVMRKIQKVIVPFFAKDWTRQIKYHAGPDMPTQYDLPTLDENAPDLYLPSMSLITYVLLCAFSYGTAGKFNPEVIPDVCTKCFLTQILEVLAIRFGFYLMQAPVAVLDLFSYTGYKYLGLCINLVIGLFVSHFGMGSVGYYCCFCWTAAAAAFFMLKTMANNIPLQTASAGPKREVMVLVFSASQLATMWFVSQTKFL